MYKLIKKLALLLSIFSVSFLLSGCYKYELDISINKQDLVNGTLIDALLKDDFFESSDSPNSVITSIPGVTVARYDQSNFQGQIYTFTNVPLVSFNKVFELPKYNLIELNSLGINLQDLYMNNDSSADAAAKAAEEAAKKATEEAAKAIAEANRQAEAAAKAAEEAEIAASGGKKVKKNTKKEQKKLIEDQKTFSIKRVGDKLVVAGELDLTTKDKFIAEAFKDAQVKISIQFPNKPTKSTGQRQDTKVTWQGIPLQKIKTTAQVNSKLIPFKNCKDLNSVFNFGIGKNNSKNKKINATERPFLNNTYYEINKALDKDKDLIVCEKN